MQHTDKYQLNLVETSDTFSPAPLNENMEKVEAQFDAEAAARQSVDAALDLRVAALEARRIVYGSFMCNGAAQTISLGFTPAMVFLQNSQNYGSGMALTDRPFKGNVLTIVPGGFTLGVSSEYNIGNRLAYYLAIV